MDSLSNNNAIMVAVDDLVAEGVPQQELDLSGLMTAEFHQVFGSVIAQADGHGFFPLGNHAHGIPAFKGAVDFQYSSREQRTSPFQRLYRSAIDDDLGFAAAAGKQATLSVLPVC